MRGFRSLLMAILLVFLPACDAASPAAPATAPTSAAEPTSAVPNGEITVFAATSLTNAFEELGDQFSATTGANIVYNFAGSDQLATQIVQGAPADVFASANKKQMDLVIEAGEVVSGTERTFVRNRLVVVYPQGNPAGLAALTDLARPGLKIVLANPSVPVGSYALNFLARASELPEYTETFSPTVLQNVVSYEENVRAVLSKVALGEADAGIVYTTDAASVQDEGVGTLDIPDDLNTIATYPIAATRNASNQELAQQFVDFVLSTEGQQILAKYGFIPGG